MEYRKEVGYIEGCYLGYRHASDDFGLEIEFKLPSGYFTYFYPDRPELINQIKSILKSRGEKTIDELDSSTVVVTIKSKLFIDELDQVEEWGFV